MPSIDAPAHYDRADYTAAGQADDFFKWLTPDDYEVETGDADSPVGWVGLVKVSRELISLYVSVEGDPWMSVRRNFEPGWYIVRIDSNGLIWGIGYGGYCIIHDTFCADTLAEENARADFAEAQDVYVQWGNQHGWDW